MTTPSEMNYEIELRGVTRRYGSRTAVNDLSLTVPRGSLYGLLGANGAGKTTCLNMITTLLPPSEGRIFVGGLDSVRQSTDLRRRIGYAPEEPQLYSGLTPREFVELSAVLHDIDRSECADRAEQALKVLGLDDRADDPIATFSKGMRRKTLLAASIAHDPDVLVLDEPLEGLDVFAQAALKSLLRERVAQGKTVLYSSHTIEVVETLCTHVGLLAEGRLVAAGRVDDLKSELGIGALLDAFELLGAR